VEVVLKERLDKPAGAHCSDWAASALSCEQHTYAALDAIKSLEVYVALAPLPDLTLRLSVDAVRSGLEVEIGPGAGSMATLSARAARCIIEQAAEWASPRGCRPATMKSTQSRVLVRVTEVLAPGLIVPNVKGADGSSMRAARLVWTSALFAHCPAQDAQTAPARASSHAGGCPRPRGRLRPACRLLRRRRPTRSDRARRKRHARRSNRARRQRHLRRSDRARRQRHARRQRSVCRRLVFCRLGCKQCARAPRDARAARAAHPPACWRPTRSESRPSPQAVIASHLRARRDSRALRVLLPRAARAAVAPDELGGSEEEEEDEEDELDDAERMQRDCEMFMQVLALVAAPITECNDESVKLSRPPREAIVDVYSAVIGDAFHFMDRPRVPINHPFKKLNFFALTNAWFAWDPVIFEKVKASLRLNGLTDREISDKLYATFLLPQARAARRAAAERALLARARSVRGLWARGRRDRQLALQQGGVGQGGQCAQGDPERPRVRPSRVCLLHAGIG
jgi:hypothetical protein